MASTTTVKALALSGFDEPPSVIEVPAPEPVDGEVLVRVAAASVNAYDTFVAMGMMKAYLPYEFPATLGQDVAGVVEALGAGVTGLRVGDRVFGTVGVKAVVHDGTFAELSNPPAGLVSRTPDDLDDARAATLGVAGTTAMSAVEAVGAADGGTVLVLGATGGVGSFAVQLAAARGARVIASVRPGDEDFMAALGSAETVDYTGDLAAAVRAGHPEGVDALIDLVNRDPGVFASMAALVRSGGRAASSVGGAGEATEIDGVAVANVASDPAHLDALAAMILEGGLRPAITRTYSLAEAAKALSEFTSEHTRGKYLITMT